MGIPYKRTVVSTNILAIAVSVLAVVPYAKAIFDTNLGMVSWEPIAVFLFAAFFATLPFVLVLDFVKEGSSGRFRYLVIFFLLGYVLSGCINLYGATTGKSINTLELATIVLAPVALLSALFLIRGKRAAIT
jgi:hypothetical protein